MLVIRIVRILRDVNVNHCTDLLLKAHLHDNNSFVVTLCSVESRRLLLYCTRCVNDVLRT